MGARVLIVEDDDDLRELLVMALEEKEYTVATAMNGVEALVRLQFEPRPSVILLNLLMPVMPGDELLEVIRLDPQLAGIPVLILSGAPVSAEVSRAADAVLPKPFDIGSLWALVEELVAR